MLCFHTDFPQNCCIKVAVSTRWKRALSSETECDERMGRDEREFIQVTGSHPSLEVCTDVEMLV